MKIKKAALLLIAVAVTLAAAPMAPAQTGAYCEGACGANEIIFSCPWTMSASECCARAIRSCGSFDGICSGDAEILCSSWEES